MTRFWLKENLKYFFSTILLIITNTYILGLWQKVSFLKKKNILRIRFSVSFWYSFLILESLYFTYVNYFNDKVYVG